MRIVQRLAGLNWIAVVLSPLAVLFMEVFWLYPCFVWVAQWPALTLQKPPLSPVSIFILLITSFSITRFVTNRGWTLRRLQLTTISCGLVIAFLIVRAEYGAGFALLDGQWFGHISQVLLHSLTPPHPLPIALIATVYLWWRGTSLGRSALHTSDIYLSFILGIIALVLLIIVWSVTWGAESLVELSSTLVPNVAAFFFAGLAALALTNLLATQRRMPPEETLRVFNRRWLPILFSIVGSIVLVGMGIASIFSAEFLVLLTRLFNAVGDLLRTVMEYLLIPLGYVAEGAIWLVQQMAGQSGGGSPAGSGGGSGAFIQREIGETGTGLTLSEGAVLAIKWTLFAIVVIAVIFLFARLITRYRSSRERPDVDEFHESLWSWGGFRADLRLFLSTFVQRLKRKKKRPGKGSPVPRWYTKDEVEGTLGIREIYQRLLWMASYFGVARRRHETPYEYIPRLVQAIPAATEQLGELTSMYIDVRYGDIEAEERQVDYANRLWRALKELLHRPDGDR